jgi:3-oxoacyl-[acyl-carrier-protein] synthase II
MSATTPARRACITGYGALSPIGNSAAAFWEGLLAGRCGLGPIRTLDTTGMSVALAGEVKDFEPAQRLSRDEIERLDRIHQFALSTAREALADAQLDLAAIDRSRVGLIVSTSAGAMRIGEAYQRHLAGAAGAFDPRRLLDFPYYATANTLARVLGVRGPVVSPSIACASGTQAVGQALDLIRLGYADLFIVGGVEVLCAFVVNGFNCLRATTADAVRPFDARRSGLLLGEGAAILVVEEREHARARGARVDVEVAGSGLAGDATHMTAPARNGSGAAHAMRMALADASVTPADVDFISAHGTGTLYNDAMEIAAIGSVFGAAAAPVPLNSIKGALGHTLAAAGAFEAIMCAQILRQGIIPATLNCEQLDPGCGLDVVRGALRRCRVRVALSTSSAFAGNNAAIVLRRSDNRERAE